MQAVTSDQGSMALSTVLDAIPEGWAARLLEAVPVGRLSGLFDLMPGESREISLWLSPRGTLH